MNTPKKVQSEVISLGNNIDKRIQNLEWLRSSSFPILSLYLGYAGKQTPASSMMIAQFHSLTNQSLSDQEKKLFKKDLDRIELYLREIYDKRGKRSLAFFSAGKNLWEEFEFEFYLAPLVLVTYSPYIKPIIDATDKYKKYMVILVDREKARLFTVYLGQIEDHLEIKGLDVPQRVKHGDDTWDAQNKIFRHIEDHLNRHLKMIAQKVSDFANDKNISFILLGGHKELLPKMKKRLPYPYNKMVLGEFVTELNIPLNEVLLHSKKVTSKIYEGR